MEKNIKIETKNNQRHQKIQERSQSGTKRWDGPRKAEGAAEMAMRQVHRACGPTLAKGVGAAASAGRPCRGRANSLFLFTFFYNSFARCFEIFCENCFFDVFVFEIDTKVIEFLFDNMYIF